MKRLSIVALTAALGSCAPDLGGNDGSITSLRVLAVRVDPAEAKPGSSVTFAPLVVSPAGTIIAPAIAWSFCTAPKALTDDNVVSSACLQASSLAPAGVGASITAATPSVGCSRFGPDSPPGGLRPRDPDETGGYYQPLLASLEGADAAFALARIMCDRPGASAAAATAFAMAYVANTNPHLLPLVAAVQGSPTSLSTIVAGARVTLEASWPSDSAETYAYYDAATDTVTTKREAMSVAWHVTAGALDTETTGRAEDDPGTTSDNAWSAPTQPGPAHLWVVLRDSRGGVDFETYDIAVNPRPSILPP